MMQDVDAMSDSDSEGEDLELLAYKKRKREEEEDEEEEQPSRPHASSHDDNNAMVLDNATSLREEAMRWQAKVNGSPFDVTIHLSYIEALRRLCTSADATTNEEQLAKDRATLQMARKDASRLFPMPPDFYLAWGKDLALTQRESVVPILQQGLAEFYAFALWQEMIRFVIEQKRQHPADYKAEEVTQLCQTALTATKWDMKAHHQLWPLFLNWLEDPLAGATPATREAAYRRYVTSPHAHLKEALALWQSKSNVSLAEENAKAVTEYTAQLALTETLLGKPVEEAILLLERESAPKKASVPIYKFLYELLVAEHRTNGDVWTSYLLFLESRQRQLDVMQSTIDRALRNASWYPILWVHAIRHLVCSFSYEKKQTHSLYDQDYFQRGEAALDELMARFMTAGFSHRDSFLPVFLAHLDALRRCFPPEQWAEEGVQQHLRQTVQKYDSYIEGYFGEDPQYRLKAYLMHLEAGLFQQVGHGRQIYEKLLQRHRDEAAVWLEAIHFEKQYGDLQHVTTLYRQAGHTVADHPESIWGPWLLHEQLHGNLAHTESAERRVMERRKQLYAQYAKAQQEKAAKKEEQSAAKKEKQAVAKVASTPATPYVHTDAMTQDKTVFISNLERTVEEAVIRQHFNECGEIKEVRLIIKEDKAFGYVEFERPEGVVNALRLNRTPLGGEGGRPVFVAKVKEKGEGNARKLTCFVSDLPMQVDRKQLETLFATFGALQEVRLVERPDMKFAYIEFKEESGAANAVAANGKTRIHDQTIRIQFQHKNRQQGGGPRALGAAAGASRGGRGGHRLQLPRSDAAKETASTALPQKKSNQQFRDLLLKKK